MEHYFEQVADLNIIYILIGFFLILELFKGGITVLEWFGKKFGIEFKWLRKAKEQQEKVNNMETRLTNLENRHTHDNEETVKKEDELSHDVKKISGEVDHLKLAIEASLMASRASLGDKINQKYKHYLEIGGIPEDEYDEFDNLHTAYNKVGGNHTGDAKFNYCIHNLPILPARNDYKTNEE